uniref:Transient receptor potential cation channel, subfamily M, member 2 n=1 Tax=Myripristis murdjan TaxID=586833 RepID=A0A667XLD5_9TELE
SPGSAIKPEDFVGESWNRHRHICEVPTDAYGDISFDGVGQKTGKYVRVSTDTRPEVLYQLLTEHWNLTPPNLLISVTGGAKNFYLKAHLKNMFHRGLIKVAHTTGAWIITGGTHTGVMKHVGQAVRDHALSSSSMRGQIVAIGVATWGTLHNRHALVDVTIPVVCVVLDGGPGTLNVSHPFVVRPPSVSISLSRSVSSSLSHSDCLVCFPPDNL